MITTTFTLQKMLEEMDVALKDEIKKQQIDDRRRRHNVSNGKLISDYNGHYIYEFALEDPWEVPDDTPASIRFDVRQEAKGFIIHTTGSTVRVTTDQPLPFAALQKAYLIDDPTALLEALRIALKEIDEGKAQLGSKSFGLYPFSSGSQVVQGGLGTGFHPDESQRQAIHMALGSEVTYIVGPPGTGKTSTLAAIAFAQLCAGHTILIAAHTNIAIDNAIIRLAEMCDKNEPSIANQFKKAGYIIRFGTPQLATRLEKEFPDVHLASIVKRRSGELAQHKEKLSLVKNALDLQISDLEQELAGMRSQEQARQQELTQQRTTSTNRLQSLQESEQARLAEIERKQIEYSQKWNQMQRQLQALIQQQTLLTNEQIKQKTDISRCTEEINVLEQRLMEAQKANTLHRLFKGIPSPKMLTQEHVNWQQKRWSCEQSLAALQKRIEALYQQRAATEVQLAQLNTAMTSLETQRNSPTVEIQQIKQLQKELTQIEQSLGQMSFPLKQLDQLLCTLKEQLEDIRQQISALDTQLANIEKQVATEARMVATTLTKTYINPLISSRRFDVIIMDEVSMASLPSVYIAASHADKSVVVIGDPQQLSPIRQAETDAAKDWLGRSLFEVRDIDLLAACQGKGNSVILQEQSRMHPVIADVARQFIYKDLLKNSPRVLENGQVSLYRDVQPLPGIPLLLCDTSEADPATTKPEGSSRINAYHALCTIELACQALAKLPERALQEGEFRVGLITPYAKQARLLQKLVRDAGLEKAIRVGTVHRFQGLEADIIIFDTVESRILPINFTKGSYGSEAMKIINVAITRAKHKLILVANYQYILQKLGEQDTLRQVVEAAHNSGFIPSTSVLRLPVPSRLPYQTAGKSYQPELLNECTFYEKFQQDMHNAQKEIVIYSPFIGAMRTRMLIPLLEERQHAGLAISVFTSSTNKRSQEAEQWLQDIGVKIYKKKDMHEKIAFIDDTIFYIGSLNILSHVDTSEVMGRVVAPEGVSELKRAYQIEAIEKKSVRKGAAIEVSYDEFPKTASSCKECGQQLVLKQRYKDKKPFYTCTSRQTNGRNHTLEEAPYHLMRLTKLRCVGCGGPTKIYAKYEDAWIECAAESPCGYRQDIVYRKQ